MNVKHVLKLFDENSEYTYQTHSVKRGAVLIINEIHFKNAQDTRRGASADTKNLKNLFSQMGLDVTVYEDLKKNVSKKLILMD